MEDEPIIVDDLLSNNYLDIYASAYGIYIPADEILKRTKYEWFARLSQRQVLESKVIICKYILLANTVITSDQQYCTGHVQTRAEGGGV